MADHPAGVPDSSTNEPGKTRTWWHPLLVSLLRHELGDSCDVLDEVSVGQLPLRLDVVLIRKGRKRLPKSAREHLAALANRLNRYPLVELKSPTDSLDRTHLDRLLGCAHLFRSQQTRPIDADDTTLIVLAPSLTKPFERDLKRMPFQLQQEEPGVHHVEGTAFETFVIETNEFAELGQPILSVFSRLYLTDVRGIMHEVEDIHGSPLRAYVIQQIRQFDADEDFKMKHAGTEILEKSIEELRHEFVMSAPAKERLEGLSPEELLDSLSAEKREKLRKLLIQEAESTSRKRKNRKKS